MAEQISHKKSLRVSRLNKDRRLLLKEYYKLEESQENDNQEIETHDTIEEPKQTTKDSDINIEDTPISECQFKDLVHLHNRLLKKETETNNSIKNTIYENYYDLIKVNDLLKEISHANEPLLERLKDTIDLLQKC